MEVANLEIAGDSDPFGAKKRCLAADALGVLRGKQESGGGNGAVPGDGEFLLRAERRQDVGDVTRMHVKGRGDVGTGGNPTIGNGEREAEHIALDPGECGGLAHGYLFHRCAALPCRGKESFGLRAGIRAGRRAQRGETGDGARGWASRIPSALPCIIMDAILEIDGLSKRYRQTLAVDGLSLSVRRGSFFGLLGPSGCGKTTTLRMIAGFETPDTGDIRLHGKSITGLKPYERRINTVFQNYALFPHLTVRGNVEFGLRGQPKAEARRRAEEALAMVRLSGKEDRYPSQLSGGEKQRAALARSLVLQPEVLLLDEPLSALDARLRDEVRQELTGLQRQLGITFLLVTHDQEEAMSLCEEIAVLNQGRLVQTGSPRHLYLEPASRFVAGFLGKVNWINGYGVRPEAVRVATENPPSGVRSMEAQVRHAMFLGNCLQVEAALPGGLHVVAETSRFEGQFRHGDKVRLWWQPQDEMHLPEWGAGEAAVDGR